MDIIHVFFKHIGPTPMPRIYVPPKLASPILSQSFQEGISTFQRRNCDSMVGELDFECDWLVCYFCCSLWLVIPLRRLCSLGGSVKAAG